MEVASSPSCAVCGSHQLKPVVYADRAAEFGICELGWATLGSRLSEPPDPLWYCTVCRRELDDQQLVFDGSARSGERASARRHREAVRGLLERMSLIDPEQYRQLRGRRWFDLVCGAFSHGPGSIVIARSGEDGVVLLRTEDRKTELSKMPGHMLEDLMYFLDAVPEQVGSESSGVRTVRCPGGVVTCQASEDRTLTFNFVPDAAEESAGTTGT